jgi:hypothetical protein
MALPRVPTESSNEKQHRTVIATTVNELVKLRQPNDTTEEEAAAGVTPLDYRYAPGDIRRYGATSGSDATAAISDAMSVAAWNKQDVIIPPGDWTISSELGFPNQYTIRGVGRGSRLLLDLSAGSWAFKYSAGSSVQSWGFEGLYFDVKPGSSQDVGAIAITNGSTLRSAFVRNIYSDNLHRILQMEDVFGSLFLQDWSCKLSHLLSDGTTSAVEPTAGNIAVDLAHGISNAVYARGLEILGFYRTAIKHTGRVFVLRDSNLAGSVTGSSELECAVHLYNSRNFLIDTLYSEKMRSQSSDFEGHASGNGSATTIIVEHDDASSAELAGRIENVNFATGSLYVLDAEGIEVENLAFAEANGGVRCGSGSSAAFADIRGGSVRARRSALSVQPNSCGLIEIVDGNNSGGGYEPNPQLGTWGTAPFANISGGSQSNETTDFISGDRAIKVTCSAQFDGVTYTVTLPKASIECTVVAKVKAQTAGADVRMDVTGNTTRSSGGCSRFKTSAVDEWQLLVLTCSSSTTSVQVRIRNGLNGAATFLIDAVNCFQGQSSFDPSQCVTQTGGQLMTGSATYDPGSLADGAGATTTVTVTGAALGDFVEGVSFSNDLQGITVTGWVSAANTVSVRFQNESGGVLDLASGTLRVRVREA